MVIHINDLRIPGHIGIVPDGNRRFAKRLLKNPSKGHEWGIKRVEKIMDWCGELGIREVTFYMLSLENIENRPKLEMDFLFMLAKKEMDDVIENPNHWVHERKTKLTCFGHIHVLPDYLQERIEKVRELTKDYNNSTLNLAIAYGGRQEIVDAVRSIARDVSAGKISPDDINETVLRHNLSTNGSPDPDLIVRTGGERRLSNFLTFQSTYSELTFLETLWPDFGKEEFVNAVKEFGERERRFGK